MNDFKVGDEIIIQNKHNGNVDMHNLTGEIAEIRGDGKLVIRFELLFSENYISKMK